MCLRCSALRELGLQSRATDSEIKSAYRLNVKAWHPDRFPGDEKSKSAAQEKLKAINFAYSYLNYLSANAKQCNPKTTPAATNSQEPAQRGWTRTGQTPPATSESAQQPPPSPNSGYASQKSSGPSTQFSKRPSRLGYLIYLVPLIFWVVVESNVTSSQHGSSSTTSTPATSIAVSPQNSPVGAIDRPSRGATPLSFNENEVEVTLENGTELNKRRHLNGRGELTVENGTSFDAVVHLVDLKTGKTIRTFFVQRGNTFTERQIASGLYGIYFATGVNWNSGLKKFTSDASYSQFGKNLEYSEKRDSEASKVEYATYKITLHPVVGGNVTSLSLDKDTFDKKMIDGATD